MGTTLRRRTSFGFAIAIAVLAALPGSALAVRTFRVSPHGSGTECTPTAPCDVKKALELSASGDTVLMDATEGAYGEAAPLSELKVPNGVSVEGVGGSALISSESGTSSASIRLGEGGTGQRLTNIVVFQSGDGEALVGGGTIERVAALAGGAGAGCRVDAAPTTIVDSVCAGHFGLFDILPGPSTGVFALTLRNDTLYGFVEAGLAAFSEKPQFQIGAVNTILRGNGTDIETGESLGGHVEVALDHSNYANVVHTLGGTVTAPGTATNQIAAPQFIQAAVGDFTELATSPTVDAGVNEVANGTLDVAGNPRTLAGRAACGQTVPAVTDIGAFEFVPPALSCPALAPGTSILNARVRGGSATFRFKASGAEGRVGFECRLDKGKFRRCSSPKTYRRLRPGRHRFAVRAVGPGGTDPTFRIRRPTS